MSIASWRSTSTPLPRPVAFTRNTAITRPNAHGLRRRLGWPLTSTDPLPSGRPAKLTLMPTEAVKRLASTAPTIGAVYYFAGGDEDEHFKGIVREKVAIDDKHVAVTLELTPGEYERLR